MQKAMKKYLLAWRRKLRAEAAAFALWRGDQQQAVARSSSLGLILRGSNESRAEMCAGIGLPVINA